MSDAVRWFWMQRLEFSNHLVPERAIWGCQVTPGLGDHVSKGLEGGGGFPRLVDLGVLLCTTDGTLELRTDRY